MPEAVVATGASLLQIDSRTHGLTGHDDLHRCWLPAHANSYCEQAWNGGGWTMLYFSTIKQRGANEWSLNWATTTTKGKRFNAAWSTNDNYLMPMHHWYTFNGGDFVFRSSGGKPDGMRLQKWQISPQDKYKMNWKAYKSNGASNEEGSCACAWPMV